MDATLTTTAQTCLSGAHDGSMDFPTIVRTLQQAGFESYDVDFRLSTITYFLPTGESVQLPFLPSEGNVAPEFRAHLIEQAVQRAQAQAPGYSYVGFCSEVKAAGCSGYSVSFLGRRVLYRGRTAETHVEHFPS